MLTKTQLQDLRAHQRTFEGAYWRTGLSGLSMGLLMLKVFTDEFYPIALIFFSFGIGMVMIAYVRGRNCLPFYHTNARFKTSGDIVVISFVFSLSTFIVLFILLYQLE